MYAIYSLSTKDLLRLSETLEYNTEIEGYTLVADTYGVSVSWSKHHKDFKDLVNDPEIVMPPLSFLKRFTISERVSIHSQSPTPPVVRDLLYMLSVVPTVSLVSDEIFGGLEYLESTGCITSQRKIEIRGYP